MKIYKYNGKCNISGLKIRENREGSKLSQDQLAVRLQLEGVNLNQKAISREYPRKLLLPIVSELCSGNALPLAYEMMSPRHGGEENCSYG